MNNFSLYTFRLYHYLLTIRDTLEYSIKRDHSIEVYNNRKKILEDNLNEGTPFGDFLKNNGEAGDKIREKVNSFITDLYSENSTILIPSGDKVRVDYAHLAHRVVRGEFRGGLVRPCLREPSRGHCADVRNLHAAEAHPADAHLAGHVRHAVGRLGVDDVGSLRFSEDQLAEIDFPGSGHVVLALRDGDVAVLVQLGNGPVQEPLARCGQVAGDGLAVAYTSEVLACGLY